MGFIVACSRGSFNTWLSLFIYTNWVLCNFLSCGIASIVVSAGGSGYISGSTTVIINANNIRYLE